MVALAGEVNKQTKLCCRLFPQEALVRFVPLADKEIVPQELGGDRTQNEQIKVIVRRLRWVP